METFSALLAIFAGNSPVPGEFSAQRPVTLSFDVFFDLLPNKRLSKQWWGWWFETPSSPLWRHCNEDYPLVMYILTTFESGTHTRRPHVEQYIRRYQSNCIRFLIAWKYVLAPGTLSDTEAYMMSHQREICVSLHSVSAGDMCQLTQCVSGRYVSAYTVWQREICVSLQSVFLISWQFELSRPRWFYMQSVQSFTCWWLCMENICNRKISSYQRAYESAQ